MASRMSEMFLVRHAQASFGADDYDRLSELGQRQALWLGEYFHYRELEFDHVICGDMVRHRETAEAILRGMGREPGAIATDRGWNEFDFEAIVSAYLEQFPEEKPVQGASLRTFSRVLRSALLAWVEDRLERPLPERWPQFEERVAQALTRLTGNSVGHNRVLLVSSGGAISAAMKQVLEAPPGTMVHMNLQLRNSSFCHLFFNGRRMHFSGFNHVPHLDHPERTEMVTYY